MHLRTLRDETSRRSVFLVTFTLRAGDSVPSPNEFTWAAQFDGGSYPAWLEYRGLQFIHTWDYTFC